MTSVRPLPKIASERGFVRKAIPLWIGTVAAIACSAFYSLAGPIVFAGERRPEVTLGEVARLAKSIEQIESDVIPAAEREAVRDMWPDHVRRRRDEANRRSTDEWRAIKSAGEWRAYRDERLRRLADSLGGIERPESVEMHIAKTFDGDGFRVLNVIFNSRPGMWITANLYEPLPPRDSMPAFVICHSHHTPKTHGELQDMGMTWARLGCAVLAMDQIGHGERRSHPFASAEDFPKEFRVSRQDYHFRYDTGIQFHLAGESLAGQIAHDLRRGVDLLLARPGVDPKRIALLGSVAGGGDPTAVAGSLDDRFAVVAPFNFGGPQPETRFPLPDDAELAFNYLGGGSWESTRNLRRSAADGFAPWVIVGSVAPRRLIYAHEFDWDRERDPVWRRLNQIYEWERIGDGIDWVHGFGNVRLSASEASHCTHIGRHHRERIHAALDRWLAIRDGAADEFQDRRDAADLLCWIDALRDKLKPATLGDVLQAAVERRRGEVGSNTRSRDELLASWRAILGRTTPSDGPERKDAIGRSPDDDVADEAGTQLATMRKATLETEAGIRVPVLLLMTPATENDGRGERGTNGKRPAVVAVAQEGKKAFLQKRSEMIAGLLERGVAVCLIDVRGTGETSPDSGRDRQSYATSLSSSELMLGETAVGGRLRDLQAAIRWVRSQPEVDRRRVALWGDSFATTNGAKTRVLVPRDVDEAPSSSEPLGGMLTLLAALEDESVLAVYIRGGLVRWSDVLRTPRVTVPHDAVVPGAIPAGDLPEIAAAISPTRVALDEMVDAENKIALPDRVRAAYAESGERLTTDFGQSSPAEWLAQRLSD